MRVTRCCGGFVPLQILNGTIGGAALHGGGTTTGIDEGTTVSVLDQDRDSGTGGGAIGKGTAAAPGGLET